MAHYLLRQSCRKQGLYRNSVIDGWRVWEIFINQFQFFIFGLARVFCRTCQLLFLCSCCNPPTYCHQRVCHPFPVCPRTCTDHNFICAAITQWSDLSIYQQRVFIQPVIAHTLPAMAKFGRIVHRGIFTILVLPPKFCIGILQNKALLLGVLRVFAFIFTWYLLMHISTEATTLPLGKWLIVKNAKNLFATELWIVVSFFHCHHHQ